LKTYSKTNWKRCKDNVYRPFGTCILCGKEYQNNNIFASKYCTECATEVKRQKTRERVAKHRAKQNTEVKI
jgi:predicted nucleic acid-binding Zn ribbon protein